jgi:O-antigen/teichoic acid export membrane protein
MLVTPGVAITAIGNALPPAAMLVTQVLLAQSLGVSGRGTVAAATAPLMLAIVLLTLGLPESITYFIAQKSVGRFTRQVGISLAALAISGSIGTTLIVLFAQPLSAGNKQLAGLMAVAAAALVPALLTAALRGVAYGAHNWWLVLAERTLSAFLQLIIVCWLFVIGSLTPMTAVVAISATTFAGALVYLVTPRWWTALNGPITPLDSPPSFSRVASYAWRMWVGSVAGIVLMRLDQVMITPLAGVDQLGIYVVAVTVSSVALLLNAAVRDVVFVFESGEPSTTRVGRAARMSTLVTALVGAGLAAASPLMIPTLFGAEFAPAVPVVAVLLLAIILGNPGSVAGAALSARGHPGLRSLALAIAMVIYVVAMFLLVPRYGGLGAALAMLVGDTLPAYLAIYWLHRYCGVPLSEFYRFRASDLNVLYRATARLPGRGRYNR